MASHTFKPETGALEIAKAYAAQVANKTVLVTGTSANALGDFIVRAFAHGGASSIIITGRDSSRLASLTEKLTTDYPNTKFRPLTLDLVSLESTKKAAEELLSDTSIPQIDILVACAGTHDFSPDRVLSPDGIEFHLAVNYLSHFYFVNKLLPKIRAAAKKNPAGETRIITLTSNAFIVSPFRFSDCNFDIDGTSSPLPADEKPNFETIKGTIEVTETEAYEHTVAYAQAKTACILWSVQLNKLLAAEGIKSFSINPGLVYTAGATPLWETLNEEQAKVVAEKMGKIQSGDEGAATVLLAALEPGLDAGKGVVLKDLKAVEEMPDWAVSSEKAEKLWELSEGLVKKAGM